MSGLRQRPVSHRPVFVAVSIVLVLALAYYLFAPPSPDAVKNRTIAALDAGDVAKLIPLARPEEITTLNLTPEGVAGVLNATIWRNGHPHETMPAELIDHTSDRYLWRLHLSSDQAGGHSMYISVVRDSNGRWKLNLTRLLLTACLHESNDLKQMTLGYRYFARLYHIRGIQEDDGSLSVYPEEAARSPAAH